MDSHGVLFGNLTQIRNFCVDVTYLFGALRMTAKPNVGMYPFYVAIPQAE